MTTRMKEEGFEFRVGSLVLGLVLLALSLFMPMLLPLRWLRIWPNLLKALNEQNQGILILAAMRLVILKTLHSLPQVISTLLLAAQFHAFFSSKRYSRITLTFIIYLLQELASFLLYGYFDGWLLSLMLVVLVSVVAKAMRLNQPKMLVRILLHALVIFSIRWLEVMPLFDKISFSSEPNSVDIRRVVRLMQASPVLNFIGSVFMSFCLIIASLFIYIIVTHRRQLERERRERQQEDELQRMQIQVLEAKGFREIRRLTHDLKTPLTVIQGLISVLHLMQAAESEQAAICERIDKAADNMNKMITDIVRQDKRQAMEVIDLLAYAMNYVATKPGNERINLALDGEPRKIIGNRVRLGRALANLLVNSIEAIDKSSGTIVIEVKSLPDHRVRIAISDNGPGIAAAIKARVFETGFTTKGTAGLGLPFSLGVVKDHGGTMEVWSVEGVGTKVYVFLPEVIEN